MKKNKLSSSKHNDLLLWSISTIITCVLICVIFVVFCAIISKKITELFPDFNVWDMFWFRYLRLGVLSATLILSVLNLVLVFVLIRRKYTSSITTLSESARSLETQNLVIETFSTFLYYAMHVDLRNDTFYEILPNPFITNLISVNGKFSTAYSELVASTIAPESQETMSAFSDPDKIRELFDGDRKDAVTEFMSIYVGWSRAYFIVTERDEDNNPVRFLLGFQKIDSEKKEEIKMRTALEEALKAEENANAAKSQFLSRMSHDIRTPMNGIVGMTALALTKVNEPDKVKYCLDKISSSGKLLLALINDILDMSRIDSGRMEFAEEKFSLSELMDNIVIMIHPQTDAKHQELSVDCAGVEHELVVGDPTKLSEIFQNLTSNAVKYTPEYGHIKVSLFERFERNGSAEYEFIVEDDGYGMSKEFQTHIFEAFAREQNEKTRNIQGTGLGLAIARNITNRMNGDLKFESEEGKGSKFFATFCLKTQSVIEQESTAFHDVHILVADDNINACETTCSLLRSIGMKPESAYGGAEAIKLALSAHEKGNPFKMALIDWKMPEVDGVMALESIKEKLGNDTPDTAIFAYDWTDVEIEARRAGAKAFISKPLFKSRVLAALHQLIGDFIPDQEEETVHIFSQSDFTGRRCLLVEDQELNMEIAKELLELTNIEVETAVNGALAVEKVASKGSNYFDIIFMDVQMPVMNGYDATKAIRALPIKDAKTIPIVAMTANAFLSDIQEAQNSGMNQHISKPIDLNILKDVLTKWLG